MFHYMHGSHDRDCGSRSGSWSKGPFGVDWVFSRNGGGRSRRMFDGGELRLVLLKLIGDEPRHGYELIRAVEDMTAGQYAPSPGVVYPALSMLAELGQIAEQQSSDTRKRFAITLEGQAHLDENREIVDAILARLSGIGAEATRPDGASIRRAMGNLSTALRDRMARGDVSEDTLHDVAALIDEVAQKIERLR